MTELGLSAAEIARQVGLNTSGFAKAIERAEQHYGYKYPNRNNVSKGILTAGEFNIESVGKV